MALTARERARIAAQEGKVRREILTKRHVRCDSFSNPASIEWLARALQPRQTCAAEVPHLEKPARPAPLAAVEPTSDFFVSSRTAGLYAPAGWGLLVQGFGAGRAAGRQLLLSAGGAGREG
jgi:hypothetical protein